MKEKNDNFDRLLEESYQDYIKNKPKEESDSLSLNSIDFETKNEDTDKIETSYDLVEVISSENGCKKISNINEILNINPKFKSKNKFEEDFIKWHSDYEKRNKEKNKKENNDINYLKIEETISKINSNSCSHLLNEIQYTKDCLFEYLIKIINSFIDRDIKKINLYLKCFILILKNRNISF
ncbi:hypothetical protein H311_01729 [Anncaliia algerae PRA109]|nr:hypothetical protein H311_01729 [Anncaliia algerae PRA109]